MTVDELKKEAEVLSVSQRADLAVSLLESLPLTTYEVSDEEVLERMREIESGEVEEKSFEELKRGLRRGDDGSYL